jgi:3-oxoadipate enol-lactonase
MAEDGAFSTSDGCRIAYTVHAPSAGRLPRLVLIHSLALDRTIWDGVILRLAGAAEILAFDCRGHGRSDRPHMAFTAQLFARDVADLMDHLDWNSATVAGCSMGGCVAQAFAGHYPDRTQALCLIDTTAWYGTDAPKQFRDRAASAKAQGMAGLINFQLIRWFSDTFRAEHRDLAQPAIDVFLANDFDCYAASCALLGDADLRCYAPQFRMPVAIVVGEEDYATPVAMAKALHDSIPGSTLKVINGGRHLTPIECPDAVAGEIAGLLGRL